MRVRPRYYLLPVASVAVVFASGVGTGLLLGGGAAVRASAPGSPADRGGPWGRGGFKGLLTDLDLSEDQRTRVEALLDRQREEFHEVLRGMRPALDEVRVRYDPLLQEILTLEQWQRFDAARGEWHRKMENCDRRERKQAAEDGRAENKN